MMFIDETPFTKYRITNTRHSHSWIFQNPFEIRKIQNRFSLNIWCAKLLRCYHNELFSLLEEDSL